MPKSAKSTDPEIASAAATLGRSGGKSGTGSAKRRSKEHYATVLAEARRKAATVRKLNQE